MTLLLLGLLIGIALGLTGAGGGALAVPLLMVGAHLPITAAAPVSLAAVALAAALGTVLAWRARQVRYRAAALMALFGIAASPAGLWAAQRVPAAPLALVFAGLLLRSAWGMWHGQGLAVAAACERRPCQLDAAQDRLRWTAPCARALALTGAAAGALSGLLGVGGGFVIVPGLTRHTDLPMATMVGTSLAVVTLVSAWGVAASAAMGHLDAALTARFALGAAVGMAAARGLVQRLPAQSLRRCFAVLAGGVAVAMVVSALRPH